MNSHSAAPSPACLHVNAGLITFEVLLHRNGFVWCSSNTQRLGGQEEEKVHRSNTTLEENVLFHSFCSFVLKKQWPTYTDGNATKEHRCEMDYSLSAESSPKSTRRPFMHWSYILDHMSQKLKTSTFQFSSIHFIFIYIASVITQDV